MSTFHGLEMAKQSLFAQQSALSATGHNIANANTKGYTRQRVNFETASPYPAASRNRPEMPGQMGTGVEAGTIQRVRHQFLDHQFRAENSSSGYWSTKADAFSRMESLMNEPSENGLNQTMDQFWQSLQDLAVSPDNAGARSVVGQRGQAVAETFHYLSDSLSSMRTDLRNQIDVTVKDTNATLDKINNINEQVKDIETNGMLANDLYDERDRLIDELSEIVNVEVSYTKSSDGAPDNADGLATIKLADENGSAIDGAVLVNGDITDGGKMGYNELRVSYSGGIYDAVDEISVNGQHYKPTSFASNGSLQGLVESYGYTDVDNVSDVNEAENVAAVNGTYTDMLNHLDEMAQKFANTFNDVHNDGENLEGDQGQDIPSFFNNISARGESSYNTAAAITVNQDILNNPDLIAAADKDEGPGDGSNASALADVFDDTEVGLGENTSVRSFYESMIGDMAVNTEKVNTMAENSGILRSQVEEQRMSVSSVSLDEEMSNMIKFQHAYSAAARSMTAVDEMIDRVINNMGLVGR